METKPTQCPVKKTTIGGQALIEGIMMQGPDKLAAVIRKADGTHVVRETAYTPLREKNKLFGIPFIRGIFAFGASLKNGMAQLMFSADEAEFDEGEPSKLDAWLTRKFGVEKLNKIIMGIAVVLGVALPVGLFILMPTILSAIFPFPAHLYWLRALLEGIFRIVIFIGFLFVTSLMKDMRRTYAYHGAEHKTIRCYEAGEALTVENVRRHSRRHPRCGTSFLFVVMLISIVIFSFIRVDHVWLRLVLRLALLPVVVNIGYEANRVVGRYDNWLTRALRAPGIALQGLTTREPEDTMIEVAIDALTRVIPETEGKDAW